MSEINPRVSGTSRPSAPGVFYGALQILPTIISAGAGIYLLQTQSLADESNWLETMAHGIGIYFIAKAFYMGRSLALQRQIRDAVSHTAYGDSE